jgi:SAM-dependent MidA family methyltransferase
MAALPLETEIRRRIEVAGPMPVGHYMSLCLAHPEHGYYITRDPLGRDGDFTTSPEISQMFGELIGLWAAAVWQAMGSPADLKLVELGPGHGTLMRDALRAAQVVPDFHAAVSVHMVEVSPLLAHAASDFERIRRADRMDRSLHDVPKGPFIAIANEFFDALPIYQMVKQNERWYERVVEIDRVGNLAFGLADDVTPHFERLLPARVREAPEGAIFEWRSDHLALELGRRIARDQGAVLAIDYGYVESESGETLQAVGEHNYADPLVVPGVVDLTAHVDFEALKHAIESMARAHGPISQGSF